MQPFNAQRCFIGERSQRGYCKMFFYLRSMLYGADFEFYVHKKAKTTDVHP